jgi:hypothetical protein
MNKLILPLILSLFCAQTFADNYCAAIRGNGELAPTHWSSLSRIIENKGIPSAAAGGSSAAVTLFLLDGISRNQDVSSDADLKKYQQSLMLKSIIPHLMYLYQKETGAPKVMRLVSDAMGLSGDGFFSVLKKAVQRSKDLPSFFKTLGEYGPLLNPELAKGLSTNFFFYKAQIEEALKVFGKFDAKNDINLFYREGIVDFKYLAILLGRIADFYASYGTDQVNTNIKSFFNSCTNLSKGKEWQELIEAKPVCGELFNKALHSYYTKPTVAKKGSTKRVFPNKMVFAKIGSGLNAFPTTALVVGAGENKYIRLNKEYIKNKAKNVKDFSLNFNNDLKYGYWGRSGDLMKIKRNLKRLFPKDTKSKKFEAVNGGVWFEALGTSPAEPGLSKLVRIPDGESLDAEKIINKKYFSSSLTYIANTWFNEDFPSESISTFRKGMFSAGGWSDLHPTLVLKANGCDDIVYLTRQDGESVFGQQIFIRLTGDTKKITFWKEIDKHNRDGYVNLTKEIGDSAWNRLYNLGNRDSSYSLSIRTADAVYCTNWNAFNLFDPSQLAPAQQDAWHAPVFVKDVSKRNRYDFGYTSAGKSPDNFPGCIPKS